MLTIVVRTVSNGPQNRADPTLERTHCSNEENIKSVSALTISAGMLYSSCRWNSFEFRNKNHLISPNDFIYFKYFCFCWKLIITSADTHIHKITNLGKKDHRLTNRNKDVGVKICILYVFRHDYRDTLDYRLFWSIHTWILET